jgi:hypothetical protein
MTSEIKKKTMYGFTDNDTHSLSRVVVPATPYTSSLSTLISYSRHRKVIVVWISIICKPFVFCNLHLNVHDYLIKVVASQHTCMSIRYLRTSTKEYAVAVMCLIEHTIY